MKISCGNVPRPGCRVLALRCGLDGPGPELSAIAESEPISISNPTSVTGGDETPTYGTALCFRGLNFFNNSDLH